MLLGAKNELHFCVLLSGHEEIVAAPLPTINCDMSFTTIKCGDGVHQI